MTAIGFLSFIDLPPLGVFGGFLVLNSLGRPLEFHCSAPILPNRAQEILYGPTLRPYLCGDLIGPALIDHAEVPVAAILSDSPEGLSLRRGLDVPVAWIAGTQAVEDRPVLWKVDSDLASEESHANQLDIGPCRLVLEPGYRDDAPCLESLLEPMLHVVDLTEPFERIREAILEAQRMSA